MAQDESKSGKGKTKKAENRSNKDEIESLAHIVTTVPAVRTQVMSKLKEAKERAFKNREQQLRKAQ
jgi:hypothetical protein